MTLSSQNKRKGSLFESQLEDHLNGQGAKARRLPRAGSKDIGDVAVTLRTGRVIVIEAKNVKLVAMADFLRQAEQEALNYANKYDCDTYGVVVVKARGQSVGKARVTLTVDELMNLLNWEALS
jgi:Holliday junction resolvase